MKLLPRPGTARRPRSDDSLGQGMDAVIMLVMFLGLGYGLDRLFGTVPVFMIVLTIVGSVGLFARFYYGYARRMEEHDAVRLAKLAGPKVAVAAVEAERNAPGDDRTAS